ncbi:MAG: mechanosensitive ion channel, partial [Bacteroidia bacterium]|nr:mechanosensitive ion channel [Bacteroidia bacterium]
GINMTLPLGGAAALLVGIGLGLQQTFNDFISGIVLLFERSVSVGDVLEFEGTVGTIKEIGLRSSIVETRENISLIVPNHLLVNNKVINWTHFSDKVRFEINIGVAYGSDAALVKKILLDIADQNPYVLQYPSPIVRLKQFGESSLDFTLYFFSRNYMVIEDIKSDIRLEINRMFNEFNITIPFPQRDVHMKSS